jgi:hypothetical protein
MHMLSIAQPPVPPPIADAAGPDATVADDRDAGRGRSAASVLRIEAWDDPVIDPLGHDPRSWYVEQFWLPILGPTATWLCRRLASGLDPDGGPFEAGVEDLAYSLGVGGRYGRNSPFARALARCINFEVFRWRGRDTIAVRRHLPPLPRRHLLRLPHTLQARHEELLATARRTPVIEQQRRRARRLALAVASLEHDWEGRRQEVETRLLARGVHPALVAETASWAQQVLAGDRSSAP